MRFVTVLIIIMLVATVYIANMAPGKDGDAAPPPSRVAALESGSERDASGSSGLVIDEGDLPASFPSELTQRSSGAPSASVPKDSPVADASRNPFLMNVDEAARRRDAATQVEAAKPSVQVPVAAKLAPDVSPGASPGVAPEIRLPGAAPTASAARTNDSKPAAALEPESLRISVPKRTSVPSVRRGPALRDSGFRDPGLREGALPSPSLRDPGDTPKIQPRPETRPKAGQHKTVRPTESTPTSIAASAVLKPAVAQSKARIAGRVTDVGGDAAPSVKVEAYDLRTGALVASATSQRDGRFTMEGLPESELAIRVVSGSVPLGLAGPVGQEACRSGSEPLGFGALCVTPSARVVTSASIVLPYSSGIQGTVVGYGGKAMDGAVVRAVSSVKGFTHVKALSTTDKEGFFFLNVVPGPYELQIAPPQSAKRERPRRMPVQAEAGSAILMDTIDLTKGPVEQAIKAPVNGAAPAAGQSAQAVAPKAPIDLEGAVDASGPLARGSATPVSLPGSASVRPEAGEVTLTGRVISTWGEAVDGIPVVATDAAGAVRAQGYTNAEGKYQLSGVPVGETTLALAPNEPLRKRGSRGLIVRVRPKPISVRSFPGQERVVVEDQVVDVAPIFRIEGKVEVSDASFEAFKADLFSKDSGMELLNDERLLRIYMRGLELVQKNIGGKGKSRPIEITPNGSFQWACSLPAEDVMFVLSPRSSIPSPAYDGPVGVEVTPAGVRTAKLKIAYPPPAVKKRGTTRTQQEKASPAKPAMKSSVDS